ncbi:MAG: MerR family transcriptional regulator [Turicibacter sp.]
MNHYKIGQLTKTMGVSSHLLKHYEKFDLIYPIKDNDTNYRYYNFGQFGRLIQSKKFRNLGFSIKETSDIINLYTNEQLNTSLKTHMTYLQNEIERLQFQKELTTNLYEDSLNCDAYLNQWFIEMMPTRYILKQSDNKTLIEENNSLINQINLIDHVPIIESILYIPKDNLSKETFSYHWCLGLQETSMNQIQLTLDDRFIKIPQHRVFVTYLKVKIPYTCNSLFINLIKETFNPLPFHCCQDLIAILLKSVFEDETPYQYFKILIPID